MQTVEKVSKLECHCEERSDVAIRLFMDNLRKAVLWETGQ